MPRLSRLLRATLVLLALAAPCPALTGETLDAAGMRRAAALSVANGAPGQALALARALLARDGRDVEALLVGARAARDLGRYDEALALAQRGWAAAGNDLQRYGAALAVAQALASDGQRTRAQWWLRRAAHHAPSDALRARAVRDLRYVRARNPWAHELTFSIAPRSNINGGSARATTRLYDLPFEFRLAGSARALSGTEIAAGLASRYRLNESRSHRTDLTFRLHHRDYLLSEAARDRAPGVKGSDFAFGSVSLGLLHERRPARAGAPWSVFANIGHAWYGGAGYMNFAQAGATQNFVLGARTGAYLSLGLEGRQGLNGAADARSARAGAGLLRVLPGGHRLRLGAEAERSLSDAAALDYRSGTLSAELALARPVAGIGLEMGLAAERQAHERSGYGSGGRLDRTLSAEVTAVFRQAEYYGFVPSLTLRAERTRSNVALFETEEIGLHMGFRSAF